MKYLLKPTSIFCSLILSSKLLGCSCFFYDAVSIEDIFITEYIFSGEVLSSYPDTIKEVVHIEDNLYDTLLIPTQIIEFKITKLYKGGIKNKVVKIESATNNSSCGIPFKIGERWNIWTDYFSNNVFSPDK